MASDIYSMLTGGYDPRAEQMKQQQAFQQQLGQATNPQAFIATVGSNLGSMLGQGIQKVAGVKDPREEKDRLKKEAMAEVQASGVDLSDQVAVLKAIMQALQKRGLAAEAMAVGASIPKAEKTPTATTTLAKLLAEQEKYKPGTPGYNAYQKAIDKESGNVDKPTERKTEIVDIDGEKLLIDKISGETIRNLGGTGKLKDIKTQVVSTNGRSLLINSVTGETIKDLGKSDSKAPIVNIAGNQENEFAKARGKNQADELQDANKSAGSSKVALKSLDQMEQVNIKGIYSGPQAEVLLATNSFLESVGLLNKEQVSKLTDSVTYDKNAKDLVMLDLDGKLGAQISDADRKYVEARIPQLRTNPQARTELIAKLREIHSNKIDKARKMKEWANKYGNLNEFEWNPPKSKTTEEGWGIRKVS